MRFVETAIFPRAIDELLDDEAYRSLQLALLVKPQAGPLIPGGRGLRKIRWAGKGKGRRGGCRIIYYWNAASETFYMLFAYAKSKQEDLTAQQLRTLARLIREEF